MKKDTLKDSLYDIRSFRDLMDSVPDVIYFKDQKGRLLLVNKAHARGLGLKPEQVVGKTDFDIFPKERAEKMRKDDEYVMCTGKPIVDKIERSTRADGIDNYVSTTKIPRFDSKGKVIGLIGITRDITRRMQIDGAKEERLRLEKKLQALEELSKLKSEFVSVVSHELRTPLAIVKEAVNLIFEGLAGAVTEKQKELLIKARDNTERLKKMIEELLEISRIESGKFKLHFSLVNLNDLLKDSTDFFKKVAQEKDISFNWSLPKQQINIFVDAERITQVISNLLNNAIKYTEENGTIKLEVRILENKVRVAVIDTGIGIAHQDLSRIFEKFVQVSRKTVIEKEGLGLGLAIVKDLVEQHAGEIWVESKLGVGSKFYFTLPRFYTTNVLEAALRDKINELLVKGETVYFINLLVVNFKEFRRKSKIPPKDLFGNLKSITEGILKEAPQRKKEKPQIVVEDYPAGEISLILPGATEKEASGLCGLLKEKIKNYFAAHKMENIFINLGILLYPSKEGALQTTQQLLANLYFKNIYIGAEIRKSKRTYYKADIDISYPDGRGEVTQAVDISQGGICFVSSRKLTTDSEAEVKLRLPGPHRPLQIKGKVAWIKSLAGSRKENQYKIGLEFIGLKQKERTALSRLLRSLSGARHQEAIPV